MSTPILDPQSPALPDPPPVTPEDLLTMPDGHRFELVNGKLVERNMGAESSKIAGKIFLRMGAFVEAHHLGSVFPPDCGYQCFPDQEKKVRYPDGSFVAASRLPGNKAPLGHVRIPPDLAIEVVSPNDMADEVEAKLVEYQGAGVRLIWIVYPEQQRIHVYTPAGTAKVLRHDDELTGEDVLPGFTCRVAELFEDV